MRKLFCAIALLGTAFVVLSCSNLVAPTKVLVKAKPAINLPMGSWKYDVSEALALDKTLGDFEGVEVYKYKNYKDTDILTYLLRYPLIKEELNFQDYLNDLNADNFAADDAINQKFKIDPLTSPEPQPIKLDLTELFDEIGEKFKGSVSSIPLPTTPCTNANLNDVGIPAPEIIFTGFSSAEFREGVIALTFELANIPPGITYAIDNVGIYTASDVEIVKSTDTVNLSSANRSGIANLNFANKTLPNKINIKFTISNDVTTSSGVFSSLTISSQASDVKLRSAEGFTINNISVIVPEEKVNLNLPDLIEEATIGQGDFFTTITFPNGWNNFDATQIVLNATQTNGLNLSGLTGFIGSPIGNANNLNNEKINKDKLNISSTVAIKAENASFSGVEDDIINLTATFNINIEKFSEVKVNVDTLLAEYLNMDESPIEVDITDIGNLVSSVTFNDPDVSNGDREEKEGLGVAVQFTKFEVPWLQFKIYTEGQAGTSDALIPNSGFKSVESNQKQGTWKVQFENNKEKYKFEPDNYTTGKVTIKVALRKDPDWQEPIILKDVYPGQDYAITEGDLKLIFDWDRAVIKKDVANFDGKFPADGAEGMNFSSLKDTLKGINFKEGVIKSNLYVTGWIGEKSPDLMIKSSYTKNTNETTVKVTDKYLFGDATSGKPVNVGKDLELILEEEDGQEVYEGPSLPLGGNTIDIQTFFTDYASELQLEYKLTLPDGGMEITRDNVGGSMKFQADMLIEIPLWFTAGEEGVAISFDDMVSDNGKDLLNREPGGTSGIDMIKYVGINFQLNSNLGEGLDKATFKIYAKDTNGTNGTNPEFPDGTDPAFKPMEISLNTDSQNIGIDIDNLPNPFIPVFRLEILNKQEFSFSKDSTISMKSIGLTADIEQSYDL